MSLISHSGLDSCLFAFSSLSSINSKEILESSDVVSLEMSVYEQSTCM